MPEFVPEMTPANLPDDFVRGYFEAMEFTDCHDDCEDMRDATLFAPPFIAQCIADCATFQLANAADLAAAAELGEDAARAGADYWYTRNGHGVGYWDRGLGNVGQRLTDAAHADGNVDLYVGDDGLVYGN